MVETIKRLPDYLKKPIASLDNKENQTVRRILSEYNLNTVCDGARCPNKSSCFGNLTATFLIMGKHCTRNCRFCNIDAKPPETLDENEPKNLAMAVSKLGLKYVVITSPTRDDLEDGGAEHFKKTIEEIKKLDSSIKVEILTPDFMGSIDSLNTIIKAKPDVFNHNMETVPRLYKIVRPKADYKQSLDVLSYMKKAGFITKTGIMVGLGETYDELKETIRDIKEVGVDILTIGQYIRPSKKHLEVEKYYREEEFIELRKIALETGIKECVSAPLVRSSYKAFLTYEKIKENRF